MIARSSVFSLVLLAVSLTACGPQWVVDYDTDGATFSLSDELDWSVDSDCPAALLDALESDVTTTGQLPSVGGNNTTVQITLAGETFELIVVPATEAAPAFGTSQDVFQSGDTSWSIEGVSFESRNSCSDCRDHIQVALSGCDYTAEYDLMK